MISLDDNSKFTKVLLIEVPWAHSYADMRPGKTDKERRERIRAAAANHLHAPEHQSLWWAFRIRVKKSGRPLDVDNVAKTIIDSFCIRQIAADISQYTQLGLYPDDTFDHVRVLQVMGNRSVDHDCTRIEIFACINDPFNNLEPA